MKKIASIALSLVLVIGLCLTSYAAEAPAGLTGQEAEAYALITACEEFMEGKSVELTGRMNVVMDIAGQVMEVTTNMTMKQRTNENGELEMHILQTSDLTPPINQYYFDGWLYTQMDTTTTIDDTKIKQKINFEDLEKQISGSIDIASFEAEMFKGATLTPTADGGCVIKLVIPGASMTDMTAGVLTAVMGSDMDYSIGDTWVYYTLDEDGMIKSMQQLYQVVMTIEGETVTAKYNTEMAYRSVGLLVQVPGPGNIYDYEETAILPALGA